LGIIVGVSLLLLWIFFPHGPGEVRPLYHEAAALEQAGQYREAIAKYEQALKVSRSFWVDTRVIDADFPTLAKYHIAACYAKLAEQEGDVSFYAKAEAILREIYQTAKVKKHRESITYIWGYILFKQERYGEACSKFEELIDNFPQSIFVEDALYALGKTHLELGDEKSARQAFQQLLDNFPNSEYKDKVEGLLGK
jgi:tetratricopeptide (TPR) repeat protein